MFSTGKFVSTDVRLNKLSIAVILKLLSIVSYKIILIQKPLILLMILSSVITNVKYHY